VSETQLAAYSVQHEDLHAGGTATSMSRREERVQVPPMADREHVVGPGAERRTAPIDTVAADQRRVAEDDLAGTPE